MTTAPYFMALLKLPVAEAIEAAHPCKYRKREPATFGPTASGGGLLK
jgi:hypothetical protein